MYSSSLSFITVEIKSALPLPLILCIVYFLPNPSQVYFQNLLSYLSTLSSTNHHLTITDDFNYPDIDWDTLFSSSPTFSMICDFAFEFNLEQLMSAPTHVKGNILDLVLTNCDNYIKKLTIHPHQGLSIQSDHFILSFSIVKSRPSPNLIFL